MFAIRVELALLPKEQELLYKHILQPNNLIYHYNSVVFGIFWQIRAELAEKELELL
jgi:hypothetical protein